ncbi:hypothetical protein [Streptomyces sp. NPDC096339]|uniref:hypothetical protein n=1 Tax=Streptomyces sp. NPDC096339 TaxID=3366086 RepID=UPI00380274EE
MSGTSEDTMGERMADRVLRGVYRRSGAWLLDELGLISATETQDLVEYGPVKAGMAFAVNPQFKAPVSGRSVVVGGACLTNTDAQLDRLRAEFVADTVQPLLLAAWAQVPCVLFLPIGEEIIVSDPSIGIDAWRRFGDGLEAFVNSIAACIPDGRPPILIRTDSDAVSATLDTAVDAISGLVAVKDLDDLYTIRPSQSGQNPPGAARLRQYQRSIVTYLPSVLSELVGGLEVQHVVVAENLHQAKAIRAARTVSTATGAQGRIDHLAHVPSPSITGTGRMARAEDRSTLFCLDPEKVRTEKLHRMPPVVRQFWESSWPHTLRRPSSAVGDGSLDSVLDEWHQLLARAAGTPSAQEAIARPLHATHKGVTR